MEYEYTYTGWNYFIKSKKIVGDQSYLDDDYETTEYIPIPIAEEGEDYQTDQPIVDLLFDNKWLTPTKSKGPQSYCYWWHPPSSSNN